MTAFKRKVLLGCGTLCEGKKDHENFCEARKKEQERKERRVVFTLADLLESRP